ncbi:hypothetical protein [Acinetobacter baumannii]|uniref:hypothetical protein n=1 Tax=Acinetobacter baumannii TaxID=470 RepID=UPI0012311752|nr:hypothetical protein [Acinetobacter baumannii]
MSSNSFEQHQLFQEEIIFDQFLYTYWDKHSRLGQIQELALPERKNTFAICYQDKSTDVC